jgi:dolichyl-phosphate-mannose--protein O-mannosyl transferase
MSGKKRRNQSGAAPKERLAGAAAEGVQRLPWWTGVALFVFAAALRLYHVGQVIYRLDFCDPPLNVIGARMYVGSGLLGPDHWWTQPFKFVLLACSQTLFGSDPVGWRLVNVLIGSGTVVMTYLLGKAVFKRPFPALFAALVIALDPLSIALSRTTGEDTAATFLILMTMYFFVSAIGSDRDRDWLLGGLFLGLAWATRWYAVIPGAVMLGVAVYKARHRGAVELARLFAYLVVVPFCVYLSLFLPWAARGHSVSEWLRLNVDAYFVQASGLNGLIDVPELAGPYRWFTGWVGLVKTSLNSVGQEGMFNDLPIWALFVPSVGYLMWRGWQIKSPAILALGGSFILTYAFYLSAQRPILLYSSLPLLPLGAIALGASLWRLFGRRAWALLAVVVAWSAYLYPLTSALPVTQWAYAWLVPLLSRGA